MESLLCASQKTCAVSAGPIFALCFPVGIVCPNIGTGEDLRDVWEWIWKESGIEFGQLILEGWRDGEPSWIHLSLGEPYRPAHKCGQVMTWSRDRGYQRVG